ncbi:MAG: glutathione S-transferase family protein [Pseudomonadota bacterium]
MADLTLVIGDKNLSSWSLRPWLALRQAGIPFQEQKVLLDLPTSRADLKKYSPTGLVPVLKDGDRIIWESLAILEYLNDQFPDKNLWPSDAGARAHARSISCEMHAGFDNLRTVWPMAIVREGLKHLTTGGVQRDIDRILALWQEALETYGNKSSDPFLYGSFSIADAMYAPVVSRFRTYGPVGTSPETAAWMDAVWSSPAMQEWVNGAMEEVAT